MELLFLCVKMIPKNLWLWTNQYTLYGHYPLNAEKRVELISVRKGIKFLSMC